MRLQIIKDHNEAITGYTAVVMQGGGVDLSGVSDNECVEILLKDCLSMVPYSQLKDVLFSICRKLRMGGTISMSGVDLRMLSLGLINRTITEEVFNSIITNYSSLISCKELKKLIASQSLKIETLSVSGMNYELTASR